MKQPLAVLGILCLLILGGLVAWAGVGSLLTMDDSSRSQGGRFYVGIAMVVALVWLIGQFSKLSKRL